RPRLRRAPERDAGRAEAERGVPHELRSLQPQRAGGVSHLADRRPALDAEAPHPQPLRSLHHALQSREAAVRARDHGAAMTFALSLLDRLPNSIAVVTENGVIQYRNQAFEETFGADAAQWIKEAARAVAGERGWL